MDNKTLKTVAATLGVLWLLHWLNCRAAGSGRCRGANSDGLWPSRNHDDAANPGGYVGGNMLEFIGIQAATVAGLNPAPCGGGGGCGGCGGGSAAAMAAHGGGGSGRWKVDGSTCYFDPTDSGADQCDPTAGRWKDDGNGGCYFDPNDYGPNQCQPPGTGNYNQ